MKPHLYKSPIYNLWCCVSSQLLKTWCGPLGMGKTPADAYTDFLHWKGRGNAMQNYKEAYDKFILFYGRKGE